MKRRIIWIGVMLVALIAVTVWERLPSLPREERVLVEARTIPVFVELEQEHGPLSVDVRNSAWVSFHTGYFGVSSVRELNAAEIAWAYYPKTQELIIHEIRLNETTLFKQEENREQAP